LTTLLFNFTVHCTNSMHACNLIMERFYTIVPYGLLTHTTPQVQWLYNVGALPDGVLTTPHPSGSVSLTWSHPLSYTDTGVYQCIADNPGGTINTTVELTVNCELTVCTIEMFQYVCMKLNHDRPFTTTCSTQKGLKHPNRACILTALVVYVLLKYFIIITYLAAAEVRTIRPHLPTVGDATSGNTFIAIVGQTGAIISCVAIGSPRPDVKWVSYNGAPLPGHVKSMMSSFGSHNPNQVVVELIWTREFASSDTGVYRCETRNPTGNNSVDVTLSIGMCLLCLVTLTVSAKTTSMSLCFEKVKLIAIMHIIIHKKIGTRVGTIVDRKKVLKQAGVVHNIKS